MKKFLLAGLIFLSMTGFTMAEGTHSGAHAVHHPHGHHHHHHGHHHPRH